VRPLSEDWRVGFSVNVPSGFGSDYGDDWAGRYYTDSFSLVYVGATPSVAYRINDQWSLGGALNITYSYSKSKSRINNPEPGLGDGKLEYEGDSVGVTGSLSLLYQWTERTRIGLAYTGETSSDTEGELELSRLGPILEGTIGRLDGADLDVENILPQRLSVGGYHEWGDGRYFTFGATWIDFSEFGTGDVEIEGDTVAEPDAIFADASQVRASTPMPSRSISPGTGSVWGAFRGRLALERRFP
jgi:long-chain fatty acid transport protein